MNFSERVSVFRLSRVFTTDYRDLAKIPAGKQPINPWARSSTNKMTTRNVSCRVLQPVPRIIDPRKIYDSIGLVSVSGMAFFISLCFLLSFFLSFFPFSRVFFLFFFFFFFFFFTSSRIRRTVPGSLSREKQPACTIGDKPIGRNCKHCTACTISPSISLGCARAHVYTDTHMCTHISTYRHFVWIMLSHTFIRIFKHEALKTRTNQLGKYAHTRTHMHTHTHIHGTQTQTQVDN